MGRTNCFLAGISVSFTVHCPKHTLTHHSGTGLSIAKIPITAKFLRSEELMWDAIDLSICSINEVCVGIIVANLPPLRKTILGVFSRILPESFATAIGVSRKHNSQFNAVSLQYTSKGRTKLQDDADGESERCILKLGERQQHWNIMKTTHVSICDEAAGGKETITV